MNINEIYEEYLKIPEPKICVMSRDVLYSITKNRNKCNVFYPINELNEIYGCEILITKKYLNYIKFI